MSDIDLPALRAFVTICEKGSVTDAARTLGVTQSALSQRLKKLELQSRHELLDRSLRPLGPTPAGAALLRRARRILVEVSRLEFDLATAHPLPLEELRLGITDSLGSTLVSPLVQTLRRSVDRVAVRVDGSAELARMLIDRKLDAIVSSDPIEGREVFERREIYRDRLVLVVPNGVLGHAGDVRDLIARLASSLPLIRYTLGTVLSIKIEVLLRRLGLSLPINLEFNDSVSILDMVSRGQGWAITTPICVLQSRAAPDRFKLFALPFGGVSHSFFLINRTDELGTLGRKLAELSTRTITREVEHRPLAIARCDHVIEPAARLS